MKEKDDVFYKVEVERLNSTWPNAPYRVWVRVYLNGEYSSELTILPHAWSVKRAKAKALKHILDIQKIVDTGMKFGVVFTIDGKVDAMEKALAEV